LNALLEGGEKIGSEMNELHWAEVSKLSFLVGLAIFLNESAVGADLFSKVLFAEVGSSENLLKSLHKIHVARLAKGYEADMRKLLELADGVRKDPKDGE
jgi:hypothetical protein